MKHTDTNHNCSYYRENASAQKNPYTYNAVMLVDDALNIYTDGSSLAGPRAGGIGIVFVIVNDCGDAETIKVSEYPGYRQATNNEMELEACIKGLGEALNEASLRRYDKIEIFTDSRYVADNYKRAIFAWPKTRWTNRETGRPILHVAQWKRLVRLLKKTGKQRRRVTIRWEKGKSHRYNRAADKAARRSARNPLNNPLSTVSVQRKTTDRQVEIGCVRMLGQQLTIKVITAEWLPSPHRCFKYKYEVLSKNSEFYRNVDIIFSTETLLHRHCYLVLLNENTSNPRIVQVLKEIPKNEWSLSRWTKHSGSR